MKICFLTQTATDISDYYKSFFAGQDLFFVTFKKPNPNAVAFVPNSTWSDGRNALWEAVKGKYDYYIFIDDDLKFYRVNKRVGFSPRLSYLWAKYRAKGFFDTYQPTEGLIFIDKLKHQLATYKPEVATVLNMWWDETANLALQTMRRGSFVKHLGYFDAQFTVLSEFAASKLLPYDNKVSGWWSAQIPVYLYTYHVFGTKAISIHELAAGNTHAAINGYRPGYDGFADCAQMLAEISQATGRDYTALAEGKRPGQPVDALYGQEAIAVRLPKPSDNEDYAANYKASLQGLENFLHPGLSF